MCIVSSHQEYDEFKSSTNVIYFVRLQRNNMAQKSLSQLIKMLRFYFTSVITERMRNTARVQNARQRESARKASLYKPTKRVLMLSEYNVFA